MTTLLAVGPIEIVAAFGLLCLVGLALMVKGAAVNRDVAYDAEVLKQHARDLLRRASTVVLVHSLIGAVLGLFGSLLAVNTVHVPQDSQGVIVLGTAALTTCFAVLRGRERAFSLRLRAHEILWKVQVEKNTRESVPRVNQAAA